MEQEQKTGVSLDDLTPEAIAKLKRDLVAREKSEREKREQDRLALIELESAAVDEIFEEVEVLSNAIVEFKKKTIHKLEPLMLMKAELGKASSEQRAFSFKTKSGNAKVEVVYNETLKYDDGLHAGVAAAKQWLSEKAEENDEAKMMTSIIEDLLGKSRQGTYSPESLWAFVNAAEDYDVPLLKQAAESVKKSLYKEMTSVSVKVYKKDELGQMKQLPLSATKA